MDHVGPHRIQHGVEIRKLTRDGVPDRELLGHQRLEIAGGDDGRPGDLPDFACVVLRRLAATHHGNPEVDCSVLGFADG